MKWEINRVSTSERIFEMISKEMSQPVGIILFGADCEQKDEVLSEVEAKLPSVKVLHGAPSTSEIFEAIHHNKFSVLVLDNTASCNHGLRHECVKVMRETGAGSVIGIYVRVKDPKKNPFCTARELRTAREEVQRCAAWLEKDPPTAEGLDYLIISEEED